jgi:hypothetical protein
VSCAIRLAQFLAQRPTARNLPVAFASRKAQLEIVAVITVANSIKAVAVKLTTQTLAAI